MTWHTSSGDRYLVDAEAHLFRAALNKALEALENDDLDCTDTLLEFETKLSRLHLFAFVAQYLLRPTLDLPPLNAWTEGAVGVIFGCLANSLYGELEAGSAIDQQAACWRSKILAAAKERGWKRTSDVATDACSIRHEQLDSVDWHQMLYFLEEQIVWSLDWSVDPFGPLAGDFREGEESYFHWRHRSAMDTPGSFQLLGELCGYRRQDF